MARKVEDEERRIREAEINEKIRLQEEEKLRIAKEREEIEKINQVYPLANSEVTVENILNFQQLSSGNDVKEVYSLEISNNVGIYVLSIT